MQETSQQEFHTMRGHVSEGTRVHMDNGDTLEIRAHHARGWIVAGPKGDSEPMESAFEVECYIVRYR